MTTLVRTDRPTQRGLLERTAIVAFFLSSAIAMLPTTSLARLAGDGARLFFDFLNIADDQGTAARKVAILAVEQLLSSLPPAGAQSITYQYDPTLGAFAPSDRLAASGFAGADTLRRGAFAFRSSFSYLEIRDTAGPISYRVLEDAKFIRVGLDLDIKALAIGLAASYGITDNLELGINIPIVLTDVAAAGVVAEEVANGTLGFRSRPEYIGLDLESGDLAWGQIPLEEGFVSSGGFDQGKNVGLGRVGIGVKWNALRTDKLSFALATEAFLPSPNENEFAGSESFGLTLPRAVVQYSILDQLRFHLDAGYKHDFDREELRGLLWRSGFSVPLTRRDFGQRLPIPNLVLDLGLGGAVFVKGIEWTPRTTRPNSLLDPVEAEGDTELDNVIIEAIAALKVAVTENIGLTVSLLAPINDPDMRPDIVGTLGVEAHFR